MGDVARATGKGAVIEFEGKRYQLSQWTVDVQANFEIYLGDCIWAAAERRAARMPIDQADRLLAATNIELEMGVASFGGKYCQQAFQNPKHMIELIYLMLLENHNDLKRDVVVRMYEKLKADIHRKLDQSMADPTSGQADTGPQG